MPSILIALSTWILFAIIIPLFILKLQLGKDYSVPVVPGNKNETETRRSCLVNGLISQPDPHIHTLYDLLKLSASKYAQEPLFGSRPVNRVVSESKSIVKKVGLEEKTEIKTWKYFELGSYEWMSYSQVLADAIKIGCGLKSLGLSPLDKVTLFHSTSKEWMLMAHGCFTQNITITTAYDTLGEQGLSFSINECQVSTLFTSVDLLPLIKRIIPLCPSLKNIIYSPSLNGLSEKESGDLLLNVQEAHSSIYFYSLNQLKELGSDNPSEPVPPTPQDLCCIMYTSGSTGNPKGVMLTHGNVIASVAGGHVLLGKLVLQDSYLAYLPLAHVLEFFIESFCIFAGIKIGYGTVRTLTDSSVRNCKGDIGELKPSIMAGVPAVWETIRKGVLSKLKEASPAQKRVFDLAFRIKWTCIRLGLPSWVVKPLDAIVFNKISSQTGGKLRILISGGAPIPKETQQFLSVCICPMIQGYGLTETVGPAAAQLPYDQGSVGIVGPPLACAEIKLVAVPDSNYTPKNHQGEIWIRGPSVMKGYYNQPEITKEVFNGEWFMTGDVGEWRPDGSLAVIDRKKNLVKLANGEYIALEKLEAQYKSCIHVANICVIADPLKSFPVGLILPIEKSLASFTNESLDLNDLVKDESVRKELLAELRRVGTQGGLKGAELLGNICILTDEWSSENGLLTAAQKIKRMEIVKRYSLEIQQMYE